MKTCNVIGCSEKHYCKGLCQKHYMQHRRGTLTESVLDTDLLLDNLSKYAETIHTMKCLFTVLDDLLLAKDLKLMEELDEWLPSDKS